MKRYYYVKLPPIPDVLQNKIVNMVKGWKRDEILYRLEKDKFGDNVNVAERVFIKFTDVPIYYDLLKIYRPYFAETFDIAVGVFRPTVPGTSAVIMPHCDRARHISLQTVLEYGGDHVQTVFYKEERENKENLDPTFKWYNEVTEDFKVGFPKQRWHCYDVQKFHAVENITTERILLAFALRGNPKIETFVEQYNHLLE